MTANAAEDTQAAYTVAFQEIKEYAGKELCVVFAEVLDAAQKSIREYANTLTQIREKEKLFASIIAIKEGSEPILSQVVKEFYSCFSGETQLFQEPKDSEILSLSLVEEEDLDESIIITGVANKLETEFELPIRSIRRGIVRLTRKLDFEPEPDALTPKQFAYIFQKATEQINLTITDKTHIYNCYYTVALEELEKLYTGTLTLLQDYGLINELENPLSPNFEIIHQFRGENTTQIRASSLIKSQQTGNESTIVDETVTSLLESRKNIQSVIPISSAPVAASAITQSIFQDNALSRMLYDHLSSTPVTNKYGSGNKNRASLDSGKLIDLLSTLQSKTSKKDEIGTSNEVTELVDQHLISNLDKKSSKIDDVESNVIDFVNKLFVAILEDPDLSDPVKAQLGRLQIPYIKVALLDISLFKEEAHPARLLLNEISLFGVGVNDTDSPAFKKIKNITQIIIDNFESNLTIFTSLLEQVRKFQSQQDKRVEAAEPQTRQKAELQAKILHIKKMVVMQLRKFLKGKELPKPLYPVVLKGFAPLFLKIYRTSGDESDEWHDAVDLFRQIIESVQSRNSVYQLGIIVERTPEIIVKASNLLGLIHNRDTKNELIDKLGEYYKEIETDYHKLKGDEEAASKQQDISDPFDYISNVDDSANDEEMESQLPSEDIVKQLPENLKPDTWCEVYMERNVKPRRLKVSTIIHETAQIVFIDSLGEDFEVKDISEFIDELDCERSKILDDNNLFDKALVAVITNLQYMKESATAQMS